MADIKNIQIRLINIMHHTSVEMDDNVLAGSSPGIPSVCTVCQVPAEFPNPDNPTKTVDAVQ